MDKSLWLVILMLLLFGTGCKEETTKIEIYLQLNYGGKPMAMQQSYSYPSGETFFLSRASFYLSELRVKDGNTTHPISTVEYVDLTHSHADIDGATEGHLVTSREIDTEQFDQFLFNVGLTEAQNKTVPADHPNDHPLAKSGEYWLAWNSYIFAKFEGFIDLDGDSQPETGVALHLGSDEAFVSQEFAYNSTEGRIVIKLHVDQVFEQNGEIYDIKTNPQIHSLSQLPAIRELAHNMSKAITIR